MKIGFPRALLYFKYKYLWETFFIELGFDIVLSEETNKKILSDGVNFSIDECCLPAKIYMGHVYSLIGKCDYILVPRVESLGIKEIACVKFNAMYDIVKNTFKDIKLLDYNLDVLNGESELKGFIKMGRVLGKGYFQILMAYNKAKKIQSLQEKTIAKSQAKKLNENGLKILIVSHPYNVYDKMIGYPVVNYVKKLEGVPIFADACNKNHSLKNFKEISSCIYWTYNKELLEAIGTYMDKVQGIILITAFPCGTDSLVNELIIRKIKSVPIINIVIDELQSETGLLTRVESFMDIIKEREEAINA